MNVPPPAAMAAPLHLYDYTHGQRRLAIWREPDPHGRPAIYAALAVPVTLQAPGEAPLTEWMEVARARGYEVTLINQRATRYGPHLRQAGYRLEFADSSFELYQSEAMAIADYLGMDASGLTDEGDEA